MTDYTEILNKIECHLGNIVTCLQTQVEYETQKDLNFKTVVKAVKEKKNVKHKTKK